MGANAKGLFTAVIIFLTIIIVIIGVSSFFSPGPLLFSEDFENVTRNQQYILCQASTIVDGRLRVTIPYSRSGCAVQLPNEYDEFVFTAYVHPVGDVHDGSINIIFGQAGGRAYEIQYRPEEEQIIHIETSTNANQEKVVTFTTGWQSVGGTPFNSVNKIKLIVTKHSFDFWVNGFKILRIMRAFENDYLDGKISIGAGAGEVGRILFEFDNIEIRELMPLDRRLHDYLIKKELEKNKKIPMQNGLCLDCDLPQSFSELSLR